MKVTGLDGLEQALNQVALDEMNRLANAIHDDAKANTPIGKHNGHHMIEDWSVQEAESTRAIAVVQNDAPHAIYVEMGTEKMAPRAMLANAVNKVMADNK